MSVDFLNQYELMVMLAVRLLGDRAYAVPIVAEIQERTGVQLWHGTVYLILERLQAKGLMKSGLGKSTPIRGGRAKRYYSVTTTGEQRLRHAQKAFELLWDTQSEGEMPRVHVPMTPLKRGAEQASA